MRRGAPQFWGSDKFFNFMNLITPLKGLKANKVWPTQKLCYLSS